MIISNLKFDFSRVQYLVVYFIILSFACFIFNFEAELHCYIWRKVFFNKFQCWPATLSKLEMLAHCLFEFDTPGLGQAWFERSQEKLPCRK